MGISKEGKMGLKTQTMKRKVLIYLKKKKLVEIIIYQLLGKDFNLKNIILQFS